MAPAVLVRGKNARMPRGQFLSQLRIRPSYVALVHVDSGEEPAELTSGEFPVRLLRMRHVRVAGHLRGLAVSVRLGHSTHLEADHCVGGHGEVVEGGAADHRHAADELVQAQVVQVQRGLADQQPDAEAGGLLDEVAQ